MSDDVAPMNLSDDDAPFTGPNPGKDQSVSQRPETDSDIDSQEYYDEGLAGAAEIKQSRGTSNSDDVDLPSGFHIEG